MHDPAEVSARVQSLRSRGLADEAAAVERDGEKERLDELNARRDDLNEQEADERDRLAEAHKRSSGSGSSRSSGSTKRK
jgi:hypothetical protein